MDLKKYGERPYILLGPMAFLFYFIFVCLAAISNPAWSPATGTLSNLGESNVPYTALFFNCGCFVAGTLVAISAFGKILFQKGIYKIAGYFFVLAGISLIMVGAITGKHEIAHDACALILFFNMGMGIVLTTAADVKAGNKLVLYSGIIILAILLIQWPFLGEGVSECFPIAGTMAWILVQTYKYHLEGVV